MRTLLLTMIGTIALPTLPAQDQRIAVAMPGVWREGDLICGGALPYRVEFSTRGVVYVPALATSERLWPVRLTIDQARRGDSVLALSDEAEPAIEGTRVEIARGPFVERYTLGAAGVEQSFVLDAAIPGDGDLVVRQRLRTDLTPQELGDCSAGFELRGPDGIGGVRFGRAVAIDAAGVSHALQMTFDGRWLEIRAAHAVLEAARYPLVLDPPIGTVLSLSSQQGDVDPDVAWDEADQRYLAVWSRRLSATASEVFAALLNPRGARLTGLLPIRTGTDAYAANPTVANIPSRGRFCIVWQQGASPFGPCNLFCRTVEASSAARSSIIGVTSGANDLDPDASGAVGGSNIALVVCHRQGEGIFTIPIGIPRTGDPRPSRAGSLRLHSTAAQPAITKTAGANGVPVAVWRRGNRIEGVALTTTGGARGPVLAITGNTRPHTNPDIDGDGRGGYLLVHERQESGGSTRDVLCQPLRWDGSRLVSAGAERIVDGSQGDDQITPAVGYLAGKYLIAYGDGSAAFLDYDIVLRDVSPTGAFCGSAYRTRDILTRFDAWPEVATQSSGGGSGDEALVVFSSVTNGILRSSVHGHVFEAFVGDGTVRGLGGRCGGGGRIETGGGPVAVGNPLFRIELLGANVADGVAAFMFGAAGASTSRCGTCRLIQPVFAASVPLRNGAATFDLPLPCSLAAAVGTTVEAQWVMVGGTTNSCPSVPGLAATDRLELTLGR